MKLLTHNMLTSNIIKGVSKGYPLKIMADKVEVKDVDFNPEFVSRMIPKLDWSALCSAASEVGHSENLPADLGESYETDQEFLKRAHHVLMQVEVIEGNLVCPESGRKFPISNGIPNMLLNEDEV
ncbi:multifunctional methyltransferase subunit TRM112-like protein [Haliotis cracherodii]|uniref:multifunctional methyltransferase subunit TRM112-like protein n=1 Tax=Haliotis rufescens TaxID=6454 RepID=UPI001EB047F1|nr:multifunctional methyltransferase subunit TRM112-like protein [Haliotis rufescens]